MKIAASWHPRVWYLRSVRIYLPVLYGLCLILSHTALRGTRYASGVQAFALGSLLAYVVLHAVNRWFPGSFVAHEAGTDELVSLRLRTGER